MSKHLGDFDASAVIYGKFTTFQPSTGAAFALAGTPALSVYKDNSTTESTSGVTLTASFDSRTGLNHFAVDTSSDGTFYSAGSFFDIVITTGTVDSVSVVGAVVASFTIRKTSALKPSTAGRTIVVDASGLADANMVKMGASGSGQAITAAAGVTFPSSVASPTNITAGTITTATNLTNAPTSGDFTTTMKTSLNAATPTVTLAASQIQIKKNTGMNGFTFLMVDGSNVPKTTLTVTAQRSIDGAALGSCANSVSEIGGGLYKINLAAGDLNGSFIMLVFSATGAQTRYIPVITQA